MESTEDIWGELEQMSSSFLCISKYWQNSNQVQSSIKTVSFLLWGFVSQEGFFILPTRHLEFVQC